jgi:hypothetical protein
MIKQWGIHLEKQERRSRVTFLEGRARPADHPGREEEVPFFFTLFPDQVSLNLPASPLGQDFIARIAKILGPPHLEPTIKCSCAWGEGVFGAATVVMWNLTDGGPPRLRELHAFLGTASD